LRSRTSRGLRSRSETKAGLIQGARAASFRERRRVKPAVHERCASWTAQASHGGGSGYGAARQGSGVDAHGSGTPARIARSTHGGAPMGAHSDHAARSCRCKGVASAGRESTGKVGTISGGARAEGGRGGGDQREGTAPTSGGPQSELRARRGRPRQRDRGRRWRGMLQRRGGRHA